MVGNHKQKSDEMRSRFCDATPQRSGQVFSFVHSQSTQWSAGNINKYFVIIDPPDFLQGTSRYGRPNRDLPAFQEVPSHITIWPIQRSAEDILYVTNTWQFYMILQFLFPHFLNFGVTSIEVAVFICELVYKMSIDMCSDSVISTF